ncbi:MAG: hypothetical protein ACRENI_00195 [Gemmatimonadaceae bacterium]
MTAAPTPTIPHAAMCCLIALSRAGVGGELNATSCYAGDLCSLPLHAAARRKINRLQRVVIRGIPFM